MGLRARLREKRRPPSTIPEAAKEVEAQAAALQRVVKQLQEMNKTLKERHS